METRTHLTSMNRSSVLTLLVVSLAFVFTILPAAAADPPSFETTARSLVRLELLSGQLAGGISDQVAERGIASDDMREEIAISTADSLRRATVCLKRRFFDGAESTELEERLLELDALAERVATAGARLGLYGHLREKLAAYLNERDWLKRQFGLNS